MDRLGFTLGLDWAAVHLDGVSVDLHNDHTLVALTHDPRERTFEARFERRNDPWVQPDVPRAVRLRLTGVSRVEAHVPLDLVPEDDGALCMMGPAAIDWPGDERFASVYDVDEDSPAWLIQQQSGRAWIVWAETVRATLGDASPDPAAPPG